MITSVPLPYIETEDTSLFDYGYNVSCPFNSKVTKYFANEPFLKKFKNLALEFPKNEPPKLNFTVDEFQIGTWLPMREIYLRRMKSRLKFDISKCDVIGTYESFSSTIPLGILGMEQQTIFNEYQCQYLNHSLFLLWQTKVPNRHYFNPQYICIKIEFQHCDHSPNLETFDL